MATHRRRAEAFAPLASHLRQRARALLNRDDLDQDGRDNAELILVLTRILEGKPLEKAFGAPGDFGYGTPIGDALAQAYKDLR